MFGSDEGLIISSDIGEVLLSTLGIDEGAYLGSSDGSWMVSIMSHLRVHCLRTHLDDTVEMHWVHLMEINTRAQNWAYHLDILMVRRLDMKKSW